MSEVIPFPAAEHRIWVCDCGCSTFELFDDGTATCANCGDEVSEAGGWHKRAGDGEWVGGDPVSTVQGNGSVAFARRRLARLAQEDDAALIAIAKLDGTVSVWAGAETPEGRLWSIDKLKQIMALVRGAGAK